MVQQFMKPEAPVCAWCGAGVLEQREAETPWLCSECDQTYETERIRPYWTETERPIYHE